jgi:hypothetical protein
MNNDDTSQVQAHAQAILKPPLPIVIVELLGALAAGFGAFFLVFAGSSTVVGGWGGAVGAVGAVGVTNARVRPAPLLHCMHPPVSSQAQTFVSDIWYGRPSNRWPVLDDVLVALAALTEATRRKVTISSLLVVARALKGDDTAFDRSRSFSAQDVHEVEAGAMVDANKQDGASGPTWIFEVKGGHCVGVWMERCWCPDKRAAGAGAMLDAPPAPTRWQ